ncbi:ABC transporter substrate-binding protein [Chromobacterium sp. ASV23]|uniref:substrate-binding periplasmic protein n=1 Tax=Chromobacterium sp. ASV23 TaxID=2795110 RepID=UPI0018ED1867|nr:transporter substrate-binding domain-containing protein [Chromobacterium sp. ASV23]
MQRQSFHAFLAILLLAISCSTRASDASGLVINFDASNPPLMYAAKQGPAGLYPALISKVCERAGIAVTLRAGSWRFALQELRDGRAAAGGIIKTASREKQFDFSQPIFQERVVMAYPAQAPRYHSLEDLFGKRVGVIAGWSYGDAFDLARKEGKLLAFDSDSDAQNLRQLKLGRLDVVLGIRESLQLVLREGGYQDVTLTQEALVSNLSYLAINKTSPQRALLTRFNLALQAMRRDGGYDALLRDFFAGKSAAR